MPIITASKIRGVACHNCLVVEALLLMLETIYRSILKMASAQIRPNIRDKTTAPESPLKTKYMAYPPDNAANRPVKKIVAPIPKYLLCSVGYFSRVERCAPEQNQKNRIIVFMI